MPIGAVSSNNMACQQLRGNSNVSFAKKHDNEGSKSHKAAIVATTIGVAAAVTAGFVFKKQIGKFFSEMKKPNLNDIKGRAVHTFETAKEKITPTVEAAGENISNFAATTKVKSGEFLTKAWDGVKKYAGVVKDFVVNMWNKFIGLFKKAKPENLVK